MRQLREGISKLEEKLKTASGKSAYIIKKTLIELRKDQYILKQSYLPPVAPNVSLHTEKPSIKLEDTSYIDGDGEIVVQGVSLMNPIICSTILCNYSRLKEDSYGKFEGDTYYLMETFDKTAGVALNDFPVYTRIVELKIDGLTNNQIQLAIQTEFGIKYSLEYISGLWRNKIPKLIAATAKEEFLVWHYNLNSLPLKKCSRCGQFKPMNNLFFSFNNTSKDGFYSMCKKCRNGRNKNGNNN